MVCAAFLRLCRQPYRGLRDSFISLSLYYIFFTFSRRNHKFLHFIFTIMSKVIDICNKKGSHQREP